MLNHATCECAATAKLYDTLDCDAIDSKKHETMPRAVVTGGNAGIGFETAAALVEKGYHTIIACRDIMKGDDAVERIKERVPEGSVEARLLDLADLTSIKEFAKTLTLQNLPIDLLINNAGVFCVPQSTTKDGFEMQIGTNHLGHFYLTSLLYPLLKQHDTEARIVVVGSSAHKISRPINFEDIHNEKRYSPFGVYAHSKLANVLFAYELARRIPKEDNVTVNVCHPGIVKTEIGRHLVNQKPNMFQRGVESLLKGMIRTPAQGAATIVHVATSSVVTGVTGKYFKNCKVAASSRRSHNEDDSKRLWELSAQMTRAQWDF